MLNCVVIRRFQSEDQDAARALILRGMEEHWGWLDHTLNRDLNDIATSYAHGVFLVACCDEEVAGTGALIPHGDGAGRVVRMSVAAEMRRQGVGRLLLDQLREEARNCGYHRLVVSTESHWDDAVSFYLNYGFTTASRSDNGHQFAMNIAWRPHSRNDRRRHLIS